MTMAEMYVKDVLFFPDPLGTVAASSPLSSLPFTDEARVFPPLGLLLLFQVGLPVAGERTSARAGKSFDVLSNRLPFPCPFTLREFVAARSEFPGAGNASFVAGGPTRVDACESFRVGKLGLACCCSRDAQTFFEGFCCASVVGDVEPFIFGVWLSV
jgi:hypothetical protein